tara:strand:- start:200 stop:430 length:231 start_codon:yes stop_codon:yes gene_type:complete
MKQLILTISLILGATASIAGSYIKYYEFPKKDCQEMFAGMGDYLKKQIKNGLILKKTPKIHLMHLNMQLRYNGSQV